MPKYMSICRLYNQGKRERYEQGRNNPKAEKKKNEEMEECLVGSTSGSGQG
jgi:hypothetical protein